MDIKEEVNQELRDSIARYTEEKKARLIVAIDTNAHSQMYGCETNKRGEAVEEAIVRNGYGVANLGLEPTFEVIRNNRHIQTHIDVTLYKGDIEILDWKVDRSFNASDHITITWLIKDSSPEPEPGVWRWSTRPCCGDTSW